MHQDNVSFRSLTTSGTKLWLDSVDPDLIQANLSYGATGATSNPIIIADLIATGRFDRDLHRFAQENADPETVAWNLTNDLVTRAEELFKPIWERTKGDDGYVSFELDPLIEDLEHPMPLKERVSHYIELGMHWAEHHPNRLVKIPATEAGLAAMEELAAAGVNLNVTLIFSQRQYEAARTMIWKGASRRSNLKHFKSVYSVFVSRIDVYTEKKVPQLTGKVQGLVGILNAQRMWLANREFWRVHPTPLAQEMVFASTGTKKPSDPKWKYVAALAGGDIQTNPPETNDAVMKSGLSFPRTLDKLPASHVIEEIDAKVDWHKMEENLMQEGLEKFAAPQKKLIQLITQKIQGA